MSVKTRSSLASFIQSETQLLTFGKAIETLLIQYNPSPWEEPSKYAENTHDFPFDVRCGNYTSFFKRNIYLDNSQDSAFFTRDSLKINFFTACSKTLTILPERGYISMLGARSMCCSEIVIPNLDEFRDQSKERYIR